MNRTPEVNSVKIYERVDNFVYSRDFGSDPMTRQLDHIIGGNVSDYDRFELIVKQIMAASDASIQV